MDLNIKGRAKEKVCEKELRQIKELKNTLQSTRTLRERAERERDDCHRQKAATQQYALDKVDEKAGAVDPSNLRRQMSLADTTTGYKRAPAGYQRAPEDMFSYGHFKPHTIDYYGPVDNSIGLEGERRLNMEKHKREEDAHKREEDALRAMVSDMPSSSDLARERARERTIKEQGYGQPPSGGPPNPFAGLYPLGRKSAGFSVGGGRRRRRKTKQKKTKRRRKSKKSRSRRR